MELWSYGVMVTMELWFDAITYQLINMENTTNCFTQMQQTIHCKLSTSKIVHRYLNIVLHKLNTTQKTKLYLGKNKFFKICD